MAADPVRIVYVEDDGDNVYVLTRRLGRRGYDVTVASDGAPAPRFQPVPAGV